MEQIESKPDRISDRDAIYLAYTGIMCLLVKMKEHGDITEEQFDCIQHRYTLSASPPTACYAGNCKASGYPIMPMLSLEEVQSSPSEE